MRKKILLTLAIAFFGFLAGNMLTVYADSLKGGAWGGGTEPDGVAPYDGKHTNFGWIMMKGSTYGVEIPSSNGNLSGHGWSENLGWVSFESVDLAGCPAGHGVCSARRVGNGFEGWARILSIKNAGANSGGWNGWIALDGGANYGVTIDTTSTPQKLQGYGWSDELGWIDFSGVEIELAPELNVDLVASPASCIECNPLSTQLTAEVLPSSTTSGTATFQFDCENDGTFDHTINSGNSSESYNGCLYSGIGSYTAAVRITQEGISSSDTTSLNIIADFCGNNIRMGSEECDEGSDNADCSDDPTATCSSSCTSNSCSIDTQTGNWREVAP